MKIIGIYRITCIPTSKSYIGQTFDFKIRITKHRSNLLKQTHGNHLLLTDYLAHGAENIEYQMVHVVKENDMSKDDIQEILDKKEREIIAKYREIGKCYNLYSGGATGFQVPAETREKLSKAHKGRKKGYQAWNKGLSGYKLNPASEERKRKIGEAQKGSKNHNYGRTTPESVKQKCRDSYHGSQCHLAKLTDRKVRNIKKALEKGVSLAGLARKYKVTINTIFSIKHGMTWKHIK